MNKQDLLDLLPIFSYNMLSGRYNLKNEVDKISVGNIYSMSNTTKLETN